MLLSYIHLHDIKINLASYDTVYNKRGMIQESHAWGTSLNEIDTKWPHSIEMIISPSFTDNCIKCLIDTWQKSHNYNSGADM